MIGTDSRPDVFDDAVHATAYMATALLKRGELLLPQRIRDHLADGPVVVHLMRGEHDVAVHEATLTSRSTLTGIEWPDDVKPKTSLTVLCPRGGASHDIGVLLPDLPVANVDWPDADLPAAPQPEPDTESELPAQDDVEEDTEVWFKRPEDWREVDVQVIRENGGEVGGELPADPFASWPGVEDFAAGETTEVFTAVITRPVFSTELVPTPPAPKPRPGWLERRMREAARLVLDHSWTATRVAVAVASFLVLAGTGVGFLLSEVAR